MTGVRRLTQADYPEYERFLAGRAETSMFLRSNARAAGLAYAGERLQARYFGAFAGDRLEGVIALPWNGNLMSQAEGRLLETLFEAVRAAEPDVLVQGVLAEGGQAARLLGWLAPPPESIRMSEREPLFRLDLARLRIPQVLAGGEAACRRADLGDLDVITAWSVAHTEETLGGLASDMRADARGVVARWLERSPVFLLEARGAPVAMATYNAALPDMVQIGGVYTPPELRARGYARGVVAGALIAAREAGVASGVLFTHSPAAERAYRALGFERAGDYHIALFEPGVRLGDAARLSAS